MIPELKNFWSNYIPYKLHPEDENYLSQNKQKYCLEISIEELRAKYGSDLKSIYEDIDYSKAWLIKNKNILEI